ncbi:MAG: GNAT family N-acetyltransferase [Devosia sp.]
MDLLIESAGPIAIIATSPALLDLEEAGAAGLCRALGVAEPASWPPEFNGQAFRDWQRKLFLAHPGEPGYAGWYVIGAEELVGTCGFKGPPDSTGEVEIGYSVIEARQCRGFASGAVHLLTRRAFGDPRVHSIAAETLPGLLASQAVLTRCGFVLLGSRIDAKDGEVLRFERKR